MSLLTPWFLLGMALVAGPIVAHLIRRATKERLTFSALRFLEASPPRLDRRSRVQNPWLLALRCLIVAVLVFGFARPFLRQETPAITQPVIARHVVAVLDESASMQRTGLWSAARDKVNLLVATLRPGDQFALLAAGHRVTELIGPTEWSATPPADRANLVRAMLDARQPGWGPTPLDSAAEAALARWEDMAEGTSGASRRELVFVSDFGAGSRLSGLANLAWPDNAEVLLEPVSSTQAGNASLQWLGWTDPADPKVAARVRVSRSFDAPEALRLQWHDAKTGAALGEPEAFTLLPGASEVRLMAVPANAPTALRLDLQGDGQPFDNQLWLVRSAPRTIDVNYLGNHAADDPQHARFYIERAVAGWREPVAQVRASTAPPSNSATLVIVTDPLEARRLAEVKFQLQAGAFVLVLLASDQMVNTASALAGEPGWGVLSSDRGDALLGQLDFQHPLFVPFADPLYSDFTRIRFWQPRAVGLPAQSRATVVARFDNGSPAVLEVPVGTGRLIVWGGDWAPTASQWVLSSKFVPWLQALAERSSGGVGRPAMAEVGEAERMLTRNTPARWRRLDVVSATAQSELPAEPGWYELTQANQSREVSLLVPSAESQTQSLPLDTWEQLGVPLRVANETKSVDRAATPSSATAIALESRQQLWRWLLWTAIALLAIESLASFAVSRRRAPVPEPAT